jgi:hypothetical protein
MRIAPSSVPAGPEPTGGTSKAQGPAAGRETPGRPQGSPGARVLGASARPVKPKPDGPGPSRRIRFYLQIQHLMSKLRPSDRAPLAAMWLRCRIDNDIQVGPMHPIASLNPHASDPGRRGCFWPRPAWLSSSSFRFAPERPMRARLGTWRVHCCRLPAGHSRGRSGRSLKLSARPGRGAE